MEQKTTLIVRGGGDLASGVIHRLYKCGYQVLVLECDKYKRMPKSMGSRRNSNSYRRSR